MGNWNTGPSGDTAECAECWAVVMGMSQNAHQAWHAELDRRHDWVVESTMRIAKGDHQGKMREDIDAVTRIAKGYSEDWQRLGGRVSDVEADLSAAELRLTGLDDNVKELRLTEHRRAGHRPAGVGAATREYSQAATAANHDWRHDPPIVLDAVIRGLERQLVMLRRLRGATA
jgi:hypothetical protein